MLDTFIKWTLILSISLLLFSWNQCFKKNTSIEGFSLASNYFKFKRIIAAKGYQQLSLTTISFCLKWLHTRQMYSSGGGRLFLLQGDGFYFKWCRITVFQYRIEKKWELDLQYYYNVKIHRKITYSLDC